MAHADDATKTWVSAIPKKNADGNVIEWRVQYKYTLAATGKDDFVHTFNKTEQMPVDEKGALITAKAPDKYTKAELLILMDEAHWDDMFAKKHNIHKNPPAADTVDASFDVSTLSDS